MIRKPSGTLQTWQHSIDRIHLGFVFITYRANYHLGNIFDNVSVMASTVPSLGVPLKAFSSSVSFLKLFSSIAATKFQRNVTPVKMKVRTIHKPLRFLDARPENPLSLHVSRYAICDSHAADILYRY